MVCYEKATKQNLILKGENINKIRQKKDKPDTSSRPACYYCGTKHVFRKENCPAFGKQCSKCFKLNHFAKCCKNGNEVKDGRSKKINKLEEEEAEDGSDDEMECINSVNTRGNKDVKCALLVNNKRVKFQVDTGASINIIPQKFVRKFEKTTVKLSTWNEGKYDPLGECRIKVGNPKTKKFYMVMEVRKCVLYFWFHAHELVCCAYWADVSRWRAVRPNCREREVHGI